MSTEDTVVIDSKKVAEIAKLARLRIDESNLEKTAEDLNKLLLFCKIIAEANLKEVEQIEPSVPMELRRREDNVVDGGYPDRILANAPETRAGFFVVPNTVMTSSTAARQTGSSPTPRRRARASSSFQRLSNDHTSQRLPSTHARTGANSGAPSMTELNALTISEARDGLRSGAFCAVELAEACLSAIEGAGALNAFVHITPDIALEKAKEADQRIKAGDAPSMCGIPIGVKDLFCTKGVPTQAASAILEGFVPDYESTVTRKLFDDGAVMLGKLNMDEFAMGSSNETSVYGSAVNPWRRRGDDAYLVPGGSSGGSASAVAADLCLGATGTDTGGSIRQPAAFTGITGIKPTYGRCSRWGIVAFASSLDQAGPMTRTVRDAAIMLQSMCGHDPMDSTCVDMPVPDFEAALGAGVKGKVVGIATENHQGLEPEIAALYAKGEEWLRAAGAKTKEVKLRNTLLALQAYYILAPAEASSNLARYDGVRYGYRAPLASGDGITQMYEKTRTEGFGDEVKRRIMIGTYVLSAGYYDAYYIRARKIRALIRRDFEKAFKRGIDTILMPVTPWPAFNLGEDPSHNLGEGNRLGMYINDIFTVSANMAGLPAVSVPAGLDGDGLPLGLQLIGRPWEEAELLNAAEALESAAGFTARPANWWTQTTEAG